MTSTVLNRYEVGPLPDDAPFGATVRGLTLAQLDDPQVRSSLVELWVDKGVLLFRDGEDSEAMQLELSRCFGPLQRGPFKENWIRSDPHLLEVFYQPDDGNIYEVDGEALGSYLPWHTDRIYAATINHGGILRPLQAPARGGMTGFLDKILAYQRLPEDLKQRIEGLHVVYAVDVNLTNAKFGRVKDIRLMRENSIQKGIMSRQYEFPRTVHPMVFEQPGTGRKVLNISPWFALGILELGGTVEGDALMHEVVAHCTSDANAYYHPWRMGDMVLWDNWRALHCCTGVPQNDTRLMIRTTIAGDYALGRSLDGPTVKLEFDV